MSPELRQAFEETNYIVDHKPPFTLNIGQACPALNELLQEGGHEAAAFITAWNPFSQPLTETENSIRQRSLIADVQGQGLNWIPGVGQHPNNHWPGEESIFIIGMDLDAASDLATRHGQWAFVWAPKDGLPKLISLQKNSKSKTL